MKRFAAIAFAFLLASTILSRSSSAQDRSQGLQVGQIPHQSGPREDFWGFAVTRWPGIRANSGHPVFQKPEDLISFFRTLSYSVQWNGIWIETTDPGKYNVTDRALLEQVKSLCNAQSIPLFIGRSNEPASKWNRYDK